MRKLCACGLLAVVAVLAVPGEAAAQRGFFRWLDRLSGPGPFKGFGFEAPVVCFGRDEFEGRPYPPPRQTPQPGDQSIQPGQPPPSAGRRLFSPLHCWRVASEPGRFAIGLEFSWLTTGENPLRYGRDIETRDDDVTLTWVVPTFEVTVHRGLDLGAAVGVAAFGGDRLPRTLYKPVIEPVRLAVKPLALRRDAGRRSEWLAIRVSGTTFPGGFRAEEFGAVPGSYEPGTELLWNVTVILDILKLASP